jgi:hypothetical protein
MFDRAVHRAFGGRSFGRSRPIAANVQSGAPSADRQGEGCTRGVTPESGGLLNPRDALEQGYKRALEDLRGEVGDPKTLRGRWRFRGSRRRLYMEKVVLPTRSADW